MLRSMCYCFPLFHFDSNVRTSVFHSDSEGVWWGLLAKYGPVHCKRLKCCLPNKRQHNRQKVKRFFFVSFSIWLFCIFGFGFWISFTLQSSSTEDDQIPSVFLGSIECRPNTHIHTNQMATRQPKTTTNKKKHKRTSTWKKKNYNEHDDHDKCDDYDEPDRIDEIANVSLLCTDLVCMELNIYAHFIRFSTIHFSSHGCQHKNQKKKSEKNSPTQQFDTRKKKKKFLFLHRRANAKVYTACCKSDQLSWNHQFSILCGFWFNQI